jgi:hypothetical protein
LPGVDISLKLLHLGMLCGKPRLDFIDRALMLGLYGGKALLAIGFPLFIGGYGGLVGDAPLVPLVDLLLARAGQTSPQTARLHRPEGVRIWGRLWLSKCPWREDRQGRLFQGLKVEEVVDRKCVGQ